MAVRDVVLYPAPAAIAVPLGVDVGRAAFSALRAVAARLDPGGALEPAFGALRDVAVGNKDIEELLGFQPLEILRKLLAREE